MVTTNGHNNLVATPNKLHQFNYGEQSGIARKKCFYWHSKPKIYCASMILEPRIHFHAFSPSSRERERRREEPIMKSIRADSL